MIADVPVPVPTIAGMPSSRLTMAAWQVRPPRSVTTAAARFITGSQSGSVISVTSTSPCCSCSRSAADRMTRAGPWPIFSPTLRPFDQHLAARLEVKALQHQRVALRMHRLGPRLHEKQLAAAAVLRPLDVHRRRRASQARVVLLDQHRPSRQRQDVIVREHEAFAVVGGNRDAARLPRAAFLVDQLELLRAELLLQDRAESLSPASA